MCLFPWEILPKGPELGPWARNPNAFRARPAHGASGAAGWDTQCCPSDLSTEVENPCLWVNCVDFPMIGQPNDSQIQHTPWPVFCPQDSRFLQRLSRKALPHGAELSMRFCLVPADLIWSGEGFPRPLTGDRMPSSVCAPHPSAWEWSCSSCFGKTSPVK